MTHRHYILFIGLAAVVGWAAFALVITRFEPCTSPGQVTLCYSVATLPFALFFFSLFFALIATLTLAGFGLRFWLHRNEIYLDHLTVSFRQGVLLSLCVIGTLLFLLLHVLTWWSGLLLVAIIILIELYFAQAG